MKNLIAMNNALKYYKENDLLRNSELYREDLSQDINSLSYAKMLEKIRRKYFAFH